jgi:outer membrane lipoprotein-sorting protein
MRKRTLMTLAAALLVSLSAYADLTVDEIVAKNLEARGGADKWKTVQSYRISGKMAMGGGMEAPFTMTKKRPDSLRIDFTFQGMTGSQVYDGTIAWMVMPFLGKKDPEQMSGDMLAATKDQADFDSQMWDYKGKGNKLELLGKADIEGTPAYKLKLTSKEGTETTVYIDAETFLEVKTEEKRKVQGQEVEAETTVGNYQDYNGILFPTSIESKAKGGHGGAQTITIEKVEINPAVADDIFKMPKKAEAPAPAVKQ